MRIAALFSGGKDSTLAMDWLEKKGHDIVVLLTLFPRRDDSYMFHVPNVRWTGLQAKALRIPHLTRETEGVKEDELVDLRALIIEAQERFQIDAVSAGALASSYQRDRVMRICKELGLVPFCPYWNWGDEEYMAQVVESGYDIIMVGVAADGLKREHLGRRLDATFLEELRAIKKETRIHLAGEGGEYETFVLDGPLFREKIAIESSHIEGKADAAILVIDAAVLSGKEA